MTRWIEMLAAMGDDPVRSKADLVRDVSANIQRPGSSVMREIGIGLSVASVLYVALFAVWSILLDSDVSLIDFVALVPAYFLFIFTPLIAFFDFPWAWTFPWLVPVALVGLVALAFRVLPTKWIRYAVAVLFTGWWAYGLWIHYYIYAGV
jgi:hypothetical protein